MFMFEGNTNCKPETLSTYQKEQRFENPLINPHCFFFSGRGPESEPRQTFPSMASRGCRQSNDKVDATFLP